MLTKCLITYPRWYRNLSAAVLDAYSLRVEYGARGFCSLSECTRGAPIPPYEGPPILLCFSAPEFYDLWCLAMGHNPAFALTSPVESIMNGLKVVAREWFAEHSPGWAPEHGHRTIRLLERDIFPWMGARQGNRMKIFLV